MVGLKEASNDVRKAADQLVKATKKPSPSWKGNPGFHQKRLSLTLTEMTETQFFLIGWLARLTVCLKKIWEYQKRNHINVHWYPQIVGADAVWPTRKTPMGMKRHLSVKELFVFPTVCKSVSPPLCCSVVFKQDTNLPVPWPISLQVLSWLFQWL